MADSKYSYDVFFRIGDDGIGEHIQVWADGEDDLMKSRESLTKALKTLGAGPLPRDMTWTKTAPPADIKPEAGTPSPAVDYGRNNPNRLPQSNAAPVCPDCGTGPMRARHPDAAKGQTYRPFWGCPNYPRCQGKRNM